eukprot:TRINITY_DN26741_c0_g2_i1.p1 TRINITY_DN26741_c0_g2~~TRINITY_DN26741_c0_g2_i1.p1  ORF type:complete len:300 (-),score=61.39 TRINITY_DN26741_c0_g2_i1:15-914(-)
MPSCRPTGGGEEEAPLYRAHVESHAEVGDHVEYSVLVVHRSGLKWRLSRRFSDFVSLHDWLLKDFGEDRLPLQPKKPWLPNSLTQALHGNDFLDQRKHELQQYIDDILHKVSFATTEAVQVFLDVRAPEPPAGLRVVPRDEHHELEIRPGLSELEGEGAPVDWYTIDIEDVEGGERHTERRDVGLSGMNVQRARIGQLSSSLHKFTVIAGNYAGESAPVHVDVDTSQLRLVQSGGALQRAAAIPSANASSNQQPPRQREPQPNEEARQSQHHSRLQLLLEEQQQQQQQQNPKAKRMNQR